MSTTIQVGDALTADDIDTLPPGSVLREKETGEELTKRSDGEWLNHDETVSIALDRVQAYVKHWKPILASLPEAILERPKYAEVEFKVTGVFTQVVAHRVANALAQVAQLGAVDGSSRIRWVDPFPHDPTTRPPLGEDAINIAKES